MTTATGVFKRKGIYHSELVPACDPQGIVVTFKGRPMESKDKKGNWYVYFECEGNEHYYNIENEDIRRVIEAAPVDRPVSVRALGTRDSATMTIEGALPEPNEGASNHLGNPGRPVDGQQNAPEEQAPQAPAPANDGGEFTSQRERLYYECALAAKGVVSRLAAAGTPLSDEERAIATTLYIQAARQ